ncbi:glycosyltransferase family 8 protein [Pleomassaria siparia CBS 279.74]|uniref:Glycosyltransferase family 8 protein n=1 Tax=Pleomassaria siparia CBS 279.74 TaxID=1314801 RepID=A0A6G1KN71_9PLEO|nr:glycosyltransferase family 8 protein [Pleomassaria siparia CBS 279.74]
MRRRRSDELPRYHVDPTDPLSFRWRRRYWLYVTVFVLFVYYLIPSHKSTPPLPADIGGSGNTNWTSFAYSLYATDSATLCHALLVFEALARHGSKADRVLFYPNYWDTVIRDSRDRDSQLLVLARDSYKVKLEPIQLLTVEGKTKDEWTGTWDKSVTKFMAFTLTSYDRVVALDSDITLLQSLDELFLLPRTPMVMPRAYWYETKPWPLTSLLMVMQPSLAEFNRLKKSLLDGGSLEIVNAHRFDMELVNERFEESAMVLPHRPYSLLTGEFRRHSHKEYLGDAKEEWDAEKIFKEAKLVHFSDWPLPKPWIMWPAEGLAEVQPDCGGDHEGTCAERRIWKGLYEDFRLRRKEICKYLSVPAPEWHTIKDAKQRSNATDGTAHEAPHAEDEVTRGTKVTQQAVVKDV